MDIFPGLARFQNTIGPLACPSHMIVEMGGNMSPSRFVKGETPSSNGHGLLIGWPVRVRRARSTFLPSPVLYPIHKNFKRAVRWPMDKVHSPFAEAIFFAHTSYEFTT
jgi:hypothetical protein